jgi:hypothetical protein
MFCRIFTCVIGPVCRPIDKGKIGWHISQGRWSACLIAEAMPKQSGNGQAKKKEAKNAFICQQILKYISYVNFTLDLRPHCPR